MMGLDPDVIRLAYDFRNRTENPDTHGIPLGGSKKSRYNTELLLGICSIKGCKQKAIDTHHIKPQKDADKHNNIDHHHKNALHNVIGLCEQHHHEIHHGNLELLGYRQTSDGVQLLESTEDD